MKITGLLAIIPFVGMLAGPIFHNSATPYILGMPFLLTWTAGWIVLTAIIMAVIYLIDPVRRTEEDR